MSIVVYKCDVCKREIELQRNLEGLERVQRCNITHGCRGKLYQVKLFSDYIRGSLPPNVIGLDNWRQRRALYNFSQPIEQSEWTITHNLGTYPSISVFVNRPVEGDLTNQEEITPQDVVVVDQNTLRLIFDRPWSGIAQLVIRQSDPSLLQPITTTASIKTITRQQISNLGEITIATRISSVGELSNIAFQLTFVTPEGNIRTVTYQADDQPSVNSAWLDYDKVIIRGKIYTIRSFTAVTSEMTTGSITNGSSVTFTGIDDGSSGVRSINSDEVLVMLATEPYTAFDKDTTHYIDTTVANQTNFAVFYDTGEFYSVVNVIQSTYPPIRPV